LRTQPNDYNKKLKKDESITWKINKKTPFKWKKDNINRKWAGYQSIKLIQPRQQYEYVHREYWAGKGLFEIRNLRA
jgi:hypothetical protein